ncbi:MAG: 4-alpha-glucanotransferase [Magnetospirillum sp.]|nr:4-alpha-glucanotransferase [Magnetospirillum sp.]
MSEALDPLAALVGIEDGWWDFFGTWRPVSDETKQAFLAAMGFAVATEAEVAASLADFDARPWRRWLEPVAVLEANADAPSVAVTLPALHDTDTIAWVVDEEGGATHRGAVRVDAQEWLGEREVDGVFTKRWRLRLPRLTRLGYHRLTVRVAGISAAMTLAVAPTAAYVPPAVAEGRKAWGIATQVYALRAANDWGVGHYGALKGLAEGAAKAGAATVGVNPLHALFAAQPDKFSPYAPSSRRFLNTAYLDIEAISEFATSAEARRLFAAPAFQAGLARLREAPLVDYVALARAQRTILEALYRTFCTDHLARRDKRGRAFRAFQKAGGRFAERFATFEALQEHFIARGDGYWRDWPEEMRHPSSPAVAAFAKEHRTRVEFFWWLQFVADQQLGAAHDAAKAAGAGIGLYRDLGVGIAGDGAEAWLEQDILALGVSVGAPPDPLALKGQDWGLVPFNPIALKEAAYAPFIGVMAANMRHAGALRLDHAMALQRLYWVPAGKAADQGAYVRFPVEDLFRLVALESQRNRCLIIGEDLGTVPDGFRERMDRMDLFAYRVLVFEKDEFGEVRAPNEFADKALAILATHDLPSARGWWNEADIGLREALAQYPRDGMAAAERAGRAADRRKMVAALVHEGLLTADFPVEGPLSDDEALRFTAAAHAYLGLSRARLMMVQIEDVLGLDVQMNLPGTTDQHPNWRLRFPLDVAAILKDPRLAQVAERLKDRRG